MEELKIEKSEYDLWIETAPKQFIKRGVSDKKLALDHVKHVAGQLKPIFDVLNLKINSINADRRLSMEGVRDEKKRSKEEAFSALSKIKEKHAVKDRIADIDAKLSTSYVPPEDNLLNCWKQDKIERNLRNLNEYDRERLLIKCCETGGPENKVIIDTIFQAHPLFPLVKPEKIQQATSIIQKKRFPELIREKNDLEAINYVVQGMFEGFRKAIDS